MKPTENSKTLLMLYSLGGMLLVWGGYFLLSKTNIPITLVAAPLLTIICGYLFVKLWRKSNLLLRCVIGWLCLGWTLVFLLSLSNYLKLTAISINTLHIIIIVAPLLLVGNTEKHLNE